MLAFKVWRGEVPSKTFASYNLPSKFLFKRNIQITHTLKTVQKVVLIIFEINLKMWNLREVGKGINSFGVLFKKI